MRRFGIFFPLLLSTIAASVWLGCSIRTGTTPTPTPPPPDEDAIEVLFQQAEQFYKNDMYEKAQDRYLKVLEKAPDSNFAPPSLYKVAGIQMKQRRYEQAVLYFDKLAQEYPRSRFAIEARYNKGYCYLMLGDPQRAVDTIEDYLVLSGAKHTARARVYLAQAQGALAQYDKALVSYAVAGNEKRKSDDLVEILGAVKTLIDKNASEKDMKRALTKAPEGFVTDYIHYRLAVLDTSARKSDDALVHLKKIEFGRYRFSFYRQADKLLRKLGGSSSAFFIQDEASVYSIGILLPLSGRFSVFGEQALHGAMLAVDFAGADSKGAKIRVVVKDSGASPETAAAAVHELAADPKVLAIVGPLIKGPAEAAAREAEALGIPIISLSTDESICDIGDYVFQNAMTLSMQVRALIRYAHIHKGCRRFAVLYPKTRLGRTYAELFAQNVEPGVADLSASVGYEVGTPDFRGQISRLRSGGGFDALFLPDTSSQIVLIAPQLVYFGVKGKVLLGTPSWNHDSLAVKAGGYLEDTVIVDAFSVNSTKPEVRAFVNRYEDDFGDAPTHLSGHAFDTVSILAHLFSKGFGESRASVRTGLLGLQNYPGVTGATGFSENGEAIKDLPLLRVGEYGIEELF